MSRLTTGEMFQAGLSLSPSLASHDWDRERRERRERRESGRGGVYETLRSVSSQSSYLLMMRSEAGPGLMMMRSEAGPGLMMMRSGAGPVLMMMRSGAGPASLGSIHCNLPVIHMAMTSILRLKVHIALTYLSSSMRSMRAEDDCQVCL